MKGKLIIIMFVMSMFLIMGVSATLNDANVYYSYDNGNLSGTNLIDLSGNGNTGVSTGLDYNQTGKIKQAAYYGVGGDSTNLGTGLAFLEDVTYSIWIKPDYILNDPQMILTRGWYDSLEINYINNKINVSLGDTIGAKTSLISAATLNNDTWTHLIVTRQKSSGNLSIYLNGNLDNSEIFSAGVNLNPSGTATEIGRRALDNTYYEGYIDEVSIYNRTLSSEEITLLYNFNSGFNIYNDNIFLTSPIDNYNKSGSITLEYNVSVSSLTYNNGSLDNNYLDNSLKGQELYLSFDNEDLSGSNPLDLSGNYYTVTNNGATTGVTGEVKEGFSFDGVNDYVELSTNIDLQNLTVSTWINKTNDNTDKYILSLDTRVRFYVNNDFLILQYYDGSNFQTLTSNITLDDNILYNVAFTKSTTLGTSLFEIGRAHV